MGSSLYFLKYCMLKPGTYRKYVDVMDTQFYREEQLEELNWSRTRNLVQFAYNNVLFYRQRFDEIGMHPSDLKTQNDFEQIPPLTRQDVRNHADEMIATGVTRRQLNTITTGGSTGEPLTVYHPKNIARVALLWRMMSWWGLKPGSSIATVYRESHGSKRLKNSIVWWPVPILQLNAASYTSDDILRFVERINAMKPSIIHGYVGAVDDVASYVIEHNLKVNSPVAIWVTSAPLSAVQETRIQQAFGAKVYDQYGSCEVYYMSAECPEKNGLHMFSDVQKLEFLDDRNRSVPIGQFGQIAVTDFDNRAFPLIRYLNGDRGRQLNKKCSCGRSLPLMDKVGGRVSDLLSLPSGRRISGEYLTTIFDNYPDAVERFQVHQKSDYSIELKVVCSSSAHQIEQVLDTVRNTVIKDTGEEVNVSIERVGSIDADRGKLRFVISDVVSKSNSKLCSK